MRRLKDHSFINGFTALCWGRGGFFSSQSYTHLVGTLGQGISMSQGRYLHTEQHKHRTHTDIRASNGIRTHYPSVRASEDGSCFKPRGHCDRRLKDTVKYSY
jgi:hypothetical protein